MYTRIVSIVCIRFSIYISMHISIYMTLCMSNDITYKFPKSCINRFKMKKLYLFNTMYVKIRNAASCICGQCSSRSVCASTQSELRATISANYYNSFSLSNQRTVWLYNQTVRMLRLIWSYTFRICPRYLQYI